MKKYFSKAIYRITLKKLALAAALTGVLSILLNAAIIISGFTPPQIHGDFFSYSYYPVFYGSRGYTAAGIAPVLVFVMFLGSAFFTYLAFRYQNKRAESDKVHSMPATRTQQFISRILAVLTYIFSIIILTSLSAWAFIAFTEQSVFFRYVILSAAGYMAGSALIAAVTAMAMSITGRAFASFTSAAVFLFLPRSILFIIGQIISTINFNFIDISRTNIFLDPSSNIPVGILLDISRLWEYNGVSETLISGKNIIYTIILAFIYFAGALYMSNRRKSELAGRSFQSTKTAFIFASLCSMPLVLLASYNSILRYVFTRNLIYTISTVSIVLVAFALIIFILISLIYNANLKGMLKGLAVFFICLISAAALSGLGTAASQAILRRSLPDEKIEYVKIDLSPEKEYRNTPVYTYGMLKSKDIKIYDENIIDFLSVNVDTMLLNVENSSTGYNRMNYGTVWCEFTLKNGRRIVRNIPIYDGDNASEFVSLLIEHGDFYNALLSIPEISEITEYNISIPYFERSEITEPILISTIEEIGTADNSMRSVFPYYLESYVSDRYNDYGSVGSIRVYGQSGNYDFANTFLINNTVPESKTMYIKASNKLNADKFSQAADYIINDYDNLLYLNLQVWLTESTDESTFDSLLHFSTNSPQSSFTYDMMCEMLEDLKGVDPDDFENIEKYALIMIQIDRQNDYDTASYIDTCIPLTDEMYDYWLSAAETQPESSD